MEYMTSLVKHHYEERYFNGEKLQNQLQIIFPGRKNFYLQVRLHPLAKPQPMAQDVSKHRNGYWIFYAPRRVQNVS